ncbi:MAG: DoxX family membrane protein [Deltaproteobacteria bacterium]|nr:DoxX family membrane protein [Deltaproteobacteria bacterium]
MRQGFSDYFQRAWRDPGVLGLGARLFLGAIFVYACTDKIADPQGFAEAVYNYQILPDSLINLTAIFLPWVEMVLGICLILGILREGTAILAVLLLLVFFGAVLFNLARGLDINCGCFDTSPGGGVSMAWIVARDAIFLLPSFYLLKRTLARDNVPGRGEKTL